MNQVRKKIKRCVRLRKIKCLKLKRSYLNKKIILNFLFWGGITILVILLISLLLAILLVMKSPSVECYFMSLTGVKNKPEILMFMGWGIGGLVAILSVMGIFQRASIMDEQNKVAQDGHDKQYIISNEQNKSIREQAAASNEQNKIMREGQIHERVMTANGRLASEKAKERIASFNDFYYLASIDPNLREYIFNNLCEHLQQIIKNKNDKNEEQKLLNILFKNNSVFDNMRADLAEIKLQGANLQNAELQGANLQNAELQKANLQNAKLRGANLQSANLQEANLLGADLQVAYLQNANMQDVELHNAKLRSANLRGANLQKASMLWTNLENANLENANLQKADLQGAKLKEVNLQGAELQGANLQRADLQNASLGGAKLQGVNLQAAKLQRADLQWAELQGADLQVADLQGANLQGATINKETIMPDGWEDMVKKDNDGKTGVLLVDDEGKVIERL